MSDTIYVVLLNYRGWTDTIACLESLLASEKVSIRVIVCDNASGDGSLDRIEDWARGKIEASRPDEPRLARLLGRIRRPLRVQRLNRKDAESGQLSHEAQLILVDNGANLGFAAGNNVGLRLALARSLKTYAELSGKKRGSMITTDDVMGSAGIMLSVFIREPEFQGQTKEKLATIEASRIVDKAVSDHFAHWLTGHPAQADKLLDWVIERAEGVLLHTGSVLDRAGRGVWVVGASGDQKPHSQPHHHFQKHHSAPHQKPRRFQTAPLLRSCSNCTASPKK